jgi:hypothetical protein
MSFEQLMTMTQSRVCTLGLRRSGRSANRVDRREEVAQPFRAQRRRCAATIAAINAYASKAREPDVTPS